MDRGYNVDSYREEIVEIIKSIRVGRSQALRDVQVPELAYERAREFLKLVQRHPSIPWYRVLQGLSDGGIYGMLARNVQESPAHVTLTRWQEVMKLLLRYALNLLLAPKRPEFQSIKVLVCLHGSTVDFSSI